MIERTRRRDYAAIFVLVAIAASLLVAINRQLMRLGIWLF
jgi:hypothetical protein